MARRKKSVQHKLKEKNISKSKIDEEITNFLIKSEATLEWIKDTFK